MPSASGDGDELEWFGGEDLSAETERRSQERRADPVACLAELLQEIFEQNTEQEARDLWAYRVSMAPAFGEDMLACLDAVVNDPPAQVAEVLRDQAGLYLYHDDEDATPYDDADTVAWLKRVAEDFRALFSGDRPAGGSNDEDDEGSQQP